MEHDYGAYACIGDDILVLPASYIWLEEILTIIPADGTGDKCFGVDPDPAKNGRNGKEKKSYNYEGDATDIWFVEIGRDLGGRFLLDVGV